MEKGMEEHSGWKISEDGKRRLTLRIRNFMLKM
jgi:hypothetical protein